MSMLRYALPLGIIVVCAMATVLDGLRGLVATLLIGAAGGVVGAVMYYGTREQHHEESSSEQPHA
jgi:hypothetical protein